MQYFFEKNIGVAFLTTIFFSKNPPGLDIVRAFFRRYTFTFFFFIFSYPGLSEVETRVLLIIKFREFEAVFFYLSAAAGKTAVCRCECSQHRHTAVRGTESG